jgi:recombinational DNA repair protein RecR
MNPHLTERIENLIASLDEAEEAAHDCKPSQFLQRLEDARGIATEIRDTIDLRFVTERDPEDGTWIEAQLTYEGVIVDKFGDELEPLDTFARTYDEFFPEG